MKHFVRNFIVSLIATVGFSFLYRAYQQKKGPLVRVVAFHDVPDAVWFGKVIGMLKANYNLLTPTEFRTKEFNTKKINILLTFDDGYESWVDVCAPILKQNNVKGLFFINSGLLDCADDPSKVTSFMHERLLLTPKAPLTWSGAETLVAEGHTIGGHSVNHCNLAVLDQSVLEAEITDDKKRIEEKLKVALHDFAYPFGRAHNYNTNVFGVAKQAGYTWQYSAMSAFVDTSRVYPRTLLEKNQSTKNIALWVEGGYDLFNFFVR